MEGLARNRQRILERIHSTCRALGRDPARVELVAVTKNVSVEVATELFALGSRDLGESRPQELTRKAEAFQALGLQPRWHFIGHLQRNKARRVIAIADTIHSVDSPALLATLDRLAGELDRQPGIYLQVKLADEDSKSGLQPEEVRQILLERGADAPLPLLGLMTIAPLLTEHSESEALAAAQEVFRRLARLAASLPGAAFASGRARLSMGMTRDFTIALACGADSVRIGSAFFRDAPPAPGRSSADRSKEEPA